MANNTDEAREAAWKKVCDLYGFTDSTGERVVKANLRDVFNIAYNALTPRQEDEDGLKPCPWCGGKAVLTILRGFHIVKCTKCDATRNGGQTFENRAIEDWNKRS